MLRRNGANGPLSSWIHCRQARSIKVGAMVQVKILQIYLMLYECLLNVIYSYVFLLRTRC
jgi:hypothetical protein